MARPQLGKAASRASDAMARSDVLALISTASPAVNGTAAAGSTGKASDAGHVHPTDTSRLAAASNLSDLASIATALSNLGFSANFAANGYAKIPAGLIVQWGTATVGGDTAVSFPVAFPNACLGCVATTQGTGGNTSVLFVANADGYSKTQFAIRPRQAAGGSVSVPSQTTFAYMALGN